MQHATVAGAGSGTAGKFHKFDPKIINFLNLWRPISRLILDVERSFNHKNDRNNLKNIFVSFNTTSKRLKWRNYSTSLNVRENNLSFWNLSVAQPTPPAPVLEVAAHTSGPRIPPLSTARPTSPGQPAALMPTPPALARWAPKATAPPAARATGHQAENGTGRPAAMSTWPEVSIDPAVNRTIGHRAENHVPPVVKTIAIQVTTLLHLLGAPIDLSAAKVTAQSVQQTLIIQAEAHPLMTQEEV